MSEPRSGWWRRSRRGGRSGLDPALEAAVQAAYSRGAPISEALARRAAEAGSREAMTVYGIGLGNRGAFAEAQHWLQRAIDEGDAMAALALGTMHMDLGDFAAAERCFRLAEQAGHPSAGPALRELASARAASSSIQASGTAQAPRTAQSPRAARLPGAPPGASSAPTASAQTGTGSPPVTGVSPERGGDRADRGGDGGESAVAVPPLVEWAERQLLLQAGDPDPLTLLALGVLQARDGQLAQAEELFAALSVTGDPFVLYSRALMHTQLHGFEQAVQYYRLAADGGYPAAQHDLAHHLADSGDAAGAERYYRMAVAGGYTDSLVNLGVLLRQRSDLDGAEECYRAAIAAGDTDAVNNLGNLLRQRGDLAGAEECYRVAAAAGNPDALASYGAVHAQRGDWDGAEEFFRRSAEAGNTAGMLNYAQALARKGRGSEAQRWLLAARDAQAPVPPHVPGPGGQGQGTDVDAVTQWLSGPATAGNLDAQAALDLLREQPPPAGQA